MTINRKHIAESAVERINRNLTENEKHFGKLLMEALKGDRQAARTLQEAISTSDVPLFLTPAVNALFLAEWANAPRQWDTFTDEYITDRYTNIVWDGIEFNSEDLIGAHDGEDYTGYGLPKVGELSEYPAQNFATETVPGEIGKYGIRTRMSWETSLRTGSFAWLPRAVNYMAKLSAEQEDLWVAKEMIDSAGVINAGFTAAVSGSTTNPVLSYNSLEDAILQSQSVRVNGRRTNASQFQLVTGYGLSLTARDILNTTEIRRTDGSDEFIINPTLGGVGYTAFDALDQFGGSAVADYWFLVPRGTPRPAILSLRHDQALTPTVFVKSPNAMSLGGGMVDALNGSFDVDDVEAKVRVVGGAAVITPEIVVASDGTGS